MSFSVNLPLDNGYLRRECPDCERQFKWHHRPTDDRPDDAVDPDVYCCPYCGRSAPLDHWWTGEQLEHVQRLGIGEAAREVGDIFRDLERKSRNSMIKFKAGRMNIPESPDLLHEPGDMVIVQSPCHPWEPIKVSEDWRDPLYCLLCGEQFAV